MTSLELAVVFPPQGQAYLDETLRPDQCRSAVCLGRFEVRDARLDQAAIVGLRLMALAGSYAEGSNQKVPGALGTVAIFVKMSSNEEDDEFPFNPDWYEEGLLSPGWTLKNMLDMGDADVHIAAWTGGLASVLLPGYDTARQGAYAAALQVEFDSAQRAQGKYSDLNVCDYAMGLAKEMSSPGKRFYHRIWSSVDPKGQNTLSIRDGNACADFVAELHTRLGTELISAKALLPGAAERVRWMGPPSWAKRRYEEIVHLSLSLAADVATSRFECTSAMPSP